MCLDMFVCVFSQKMLIKVMRGTNFAQTGAALTITVYRACAQDFVATGEGEGGQIFFNRRSDMT